MRIGGCLLATFLLAACGQGAQSDVEAAVEVDDPLECAATISAYSYLVAEGYLASDPAIPPSRGLASSMTYLNIYAIPKDLSEAEAFAQAEARREEIRADASADEILEEARICVENTPEV